MQDLCEDVRGEGAGDHQQEMMRDRRRCCELKNCVTWQQSDLSFHSHRVSFISCCSEFSSVILLRRCWLLARIRTKMRRLQHFNPTCTETKTTNITCSMLRSTATYPTMTPHAPLIPS